MKLVKRISRLVTANVNHMLDLAEDPEVMVKQIVRDMEEGIIELRRETVRAVTREKQLEKQIKTAEEMVADLEEKAKGALKAGDEELARKIISRKLLTVETLENLKEEHADALKTAEQLKGDMSRLKEQMQSARKKRDELIRRKQAAESKKRSADVMQRSAELSGAAASLKDSSRALEAYEEAILKMESEAEATREILDDDIRKELDLQKLDENAAIEEELERLKDEEGSN